MNCDCANGHKDQIERYPLGREVKTTMPIYSGDALIPVGTKGRVFGHCVDGRAYIKFEFDNSSHTFHCPEANLELLPEPFYEEKTYCECCGHAL